MLEMATFCVIPRVATSNYHHSTFDFSQDFCYYANAILVAYLLFFPTNDRLFLMCFAFAEVSWFLLMSIKQLGQNCNPNQAT